jgi:Skp family chaperone for outer membrane proteins
MLAAAFIFAAIFSVSAIAQTAPPASGKIGLVNTYAFGDDKAGITKFKNAMSSLDAEFKTVNDQLKTKAARYTTLGNEIKAANTTNPAVPINQQSIQAKVDEYQSLETEIKRMQEDAKTKYERRYAEVVGPVFNDIIKALNDFARQKGYAVILDGAKLEEAQILLGFDDKYDVTKDFITFYNARPAGTATTTTPK